MRFFQRFINFSLIICLSAPLLHGQINTEKLRQSAWEEGWNVRVGLDLSFRRGNVEKTDYLLDGVLGWRRGDHLVFGKILGEFEDASGSQIYNAAFVHLRYNLHLKTPITPEIFTQYQFDKSLKLNTRFLIGSGIRLEGNVTKNLYMAFGTGYMWEQENYEQDISLTTPRWTNYMVVNWHPKPPVSISNTLYAQPAFDEFSFIRILNEGSLRVELTRHIVLRMTLNYRYDSDPMFQLRKYDISLTNGLEVRF
ncbi:MAG: DUF481 domain-containing protein [Candidatus Marinimicrobia bacterium]|nr:DUF481 domain-containing protein [Candidatus Neomarinimicrobiota bacterium]MCF7840471.1 DUF481 domain-containing protein [Candidatus Neomarinimicrobiota bacterium]